MGIVSSNKTYLTWFGKRTEFDPELISVDLRCDVVNKPILAWWGSPENAEFGWREWCKSEQYNIDNVLKEPLRWHLKEGNKVYEITENEITISPENKFLNYIKVTKDFLGKDSSADDYTIDKKIELLSSNGEDITFGLGLGYTYIDFEKLVKDGICGIELTDSCIGHIFINQIELMFNGWDCESIAILDPEQIIFE